MKSAIIPQIHTSPRGAAHTCQEGEPAAAVTRDGSTGSRTPQGEEGGTPTPKLAQKRVGEASTLGGRQYRLAARSLHTGATKSRRAHRRPSLCQHDGCAGKQK